MADNGKQHLMRSMIDLAGGTLGGIASVYVGQPLDTVKVKMQTFPTLYKNGLRCFLQTYAQDGIWKGLYAGTVPTLAAQVTENAVLFLAYGRCQTAIAYVAGKSDAKHLSPIQNGLAGSASGFFCSLTLCPTELIKCKQQAMREKINAGLVTGVTMKDVTPSSVTRQVLREEGPRGMFRGLVPTFAREMPGFFFMFFSYEYTKRFLSGNRPDADLSLLKTMLCGGIGGVSFWVMIFPADVVKSRAQVNVSGGKNQPFFGTLVHMLKNEGFFSLYKGLSPTIVRTFFATGALFIAYEYTKEFLTDLLIASND